MLAHRLTTILPAMTLPEALETTRLHRVAGRTGGAAPWPSRALFVPPTTPSRLWG
jgi:magnesium chelatase family protein